MAFDGATIYTNGCTSLSVNGNGLAYNYVPVDREAVGYDVIMAGNDMMCIGHPRPTETSVVASKRAAKTVVRATANDFAGNDSACDDVQSWEQNGGVQLDHVSGSRIGGSGESRAPRYGT